MQGKWSLLPRMEMKVLLGVGHDAEKDADSEDSLSKKGLCVSPFQL